MFIATLYGSTHLSYKVWNRWNENPVIVSFEDKMRSVSEIPFPAVTICQESKTNASKFSFTKVCKKVSNNETLDKFE